MRGCARRARRKASNASPGYCLDGGGSIEELVVDAIRQYSEAQDACVLRGNGSHAMAAWLSGTGIAVLRLGAAMSD